jgi:hypothetical protein
MVFSLIEMHGFLLYIHKLFFWLMLLSITKYLLYIQSTTVYVPSSELGLPK